MKFRFHPGIVITVLTATLLALAIGFGADLALHRSKPAAPLGASRISAKPRPVLPLPKVEPLVLADLTPDQARAANALTPFAGSLNRPAKPFNLGGSAVEKERALTCLASALWHEAGDDRIGQQAVAQVVLNRVRHPAFPKSVCGVVFQGAERETGCQFTFACDGSLDRRPSAAAWARARKVAASAMSGFVFKGVGTATHYHTDWVVPYWSASLDKIAAVHSQLFFRWRGWWGQAGAFTGRYQGPEAMDPRIAYLASVEAQAVGPEIDPGEGLAKPPSLTIAGVPKSVLGHNQVRLIDTAKAQYVLELDAAASPGSYAAAALEICKGKRACTVMGWLKPERMPKALPVTPSMMGGVSFLFRRQVALKREQVLWNCVQLPRQDPLQCLPGTGPTNGGAQQ